MRRDPGHRSAAGKNSALGKTVISPTAAVLGEIGLPAPVRELASAPVGCDYSRSRPQRPCLRGIPGACGQARAGA